MIIYSHFFHFEILDTRVGVRHGFRKTEITQQPALEEANQAAG